MGKLKVYIVTQLSSDGSVCCGDIVWLSDDECLVDAFQGVWSEKEECTMEKKKEVFENRKENVLF